MDLRSLNLGMRRDFTRRCVIPCRLQEKLPALRSHIAVHTRLRRANVIPQCQSHRRRHLRKPPGGIPGMTRSAGNHSGVRHHTTHYIRTAPCPHVACRRRRLALDRLALAEAEFDAMLRDVNTNAPTDRGSPPKDSGWRFCGDYRTLEARTIPYSYPCFTYTRLIPPPFRLFQNRTRMA